MNPFDMTDDEVDKILFGDGSEPNPPLGIIRFKCKPLSVKSAIGEDD